MTFMVVSSAAERDREDCRGPLPDRVDVQRGERTGVTVDAVRGETPGRRPRREEGVSAMGTSLAARASTPKATIRSSSCRPTYTTSAMSFRSSGVASLDRPGTLHYPP